MNRHIALIALICVMTPTLVMAEHHDHSAAVAAHDNARIDRKDARIATSTNPATVARLEAGVAHIKAACGAFCQ